MVERISALPALMRLANSTSHLSVCPTCSSSQSTASANFRNGRMYVVVCSRCGWLGRLRREELIHGQLAQREPLSLLGAEFLPPFIDRLELGVLRGLFVVEGGRGLVGAVHDVVGKFVQ